MKYRKLLVVKANGEMRVANDNARVKNNLKLDEVAYPLLVDLPAAWGHIQAEEIRLQMPGPPTVTKGPKP